MARTVYATLMASILVLGSFSTILVVMVSSGGIIGGYDIWAQALPSDGMVKSEQKISSTKGDFGGVLEYYDRFGRSVASIGDLDGGGITDLAVGEHQDKDGAMIEAQSIYYS